MTGRFPVFFGIIAALALIFSGLAHAQDVQTPAPAATEKIRDFVKLLDDPDVRAWLNTAPASGKETEGAALPGVGELASGDTALRHHIADMKQALRELPANVSAAFNLVREDGGGLGPLFLLGAASLVVGFAAEFIARRLLRQSVAPAPGDTPAGLLAGCVPLCVFAVAGLLTFLVIGGSPLARRITLVYFVALVLVRAISMISYICARVVGLSRSAADEGGASEQKPIETQDFWPRRITLFAAYLFAGWATLSLLATLGFSPNTQKLLAYVAGLGLLALAIEFAWRSRGAATSMSLQGKVLLTIFLILLWCIWALGLNILFWIGVYVLLLPKTLALAGNVASSIVRLRLSSAPSSPIWSVLVERGARALVVLLAVLWIAFVLRIHPGILAEEGSFGSRLIQSAMQAVVTLLIADLLWHLAKTYIDHTMSDSEIDPTGRSGRIRTLLPIFRNALAVLVFVVAGLMVLGEFGVQIAPLIAGAGIFGVAIGFGSQTLVKDIVSGIFYLADDAFRVGEYIQSGSYKGTVEGFSLRSVRLRHHRGAVFTVPFGQLGAVQNMSRDWVIDKFIIRFPFDTDIKLIKRLTKVIGASLMEDEELAPIILQTVKMKGVEQIGDYGIDVSFGFMTKPGYQTTVRRRAYNLMRDNFAANGIEFARPSVEVGGADSHATSGAAAQLIKAKAEQAAAVK